MLLEKVRHFIEVHALFWPGERVLVGVSGGVDSVVLLEVLRRLGYVPVVAHVNYRLRGADSDADEAFVRALCRKHRIPLRIARLQLKAKVQGDSIQAAARRVRYGFFTRLAQREGIKAVAVGHHRDDQAETLLLNLLRGSGLEGLTGMAPARRLHPKQPLRLVRPLLCVTRAEIEAWAYAEGLTWREDASNASLNYRRAFLRRVVFPLFREHFGANVAERLAHTAEVLRAYRQSTFTQLLAQHWACVAEADAVGGWLRYEALIAMPEVWQQRLVIEALMRWLPGAPRHRRLVQQVLRLLGSQPGRRLELLQGTIWRDRKGLRFRRRASITSGEEEGALELGKLLTLSGGIFEAVLLPQKPVYLDTGSPAAVYVDADRLQWPLWVRRWQPGDRLQPLGMQGHKKVSDLLTDLRVPVDQRRHCYVVCHGEEIVWVAGYRLAEPFRVRPETVRVVQLRFMPNHV